MKTIFIHESGTLGFYCREPYFVMAALMIDDEKALKRMKNLIRRVNGHVLRRYKPQSFLVDWYVKEHIEQYITKSLPARDDHSITYVVMKRDKKETRMRNKAARIHMRQVLLRRLLLDTLVQCHEDVRIVVSNKTIKAATARQMQCYMQQQAREHGYQHTLVIDTVEPQTHYGLRIVHFITHLVFVTYMRPVYLGRVLHNLPLAQLRIAKGEFIHESHTDWLIDQLA